ncbi:MAG: hypothetical protein AAGF12_43375, partial [Myxococcota bacterium]
LRRAFLALLLLALPRCTNSSVLLAGPSGADSSVDPDASSDAANADTTPDAETLPGDGSPNCTDAPLLPNDAVWPNQRIASAIAPRPLPESCYSGVLNPSLYYRLEVPSNVGVEVSVTAPAGQRPDVSMADACTPENPGGRCEYWQTSTSGPRATEFVSNSTTASLTVIVRVSFEEPLVGQATITTRSVLLDGGIDCANAPTLIPETVVTTGRGNVIDNCDFTGERVFHQLLLPPRTVAEPLADATFPGAWSCRCDDRPSLRNASDAPQAVTATSSPLTQVGWTATPLEANAICADARRIAPGSPSAPQRLFLGGERMSACSGGMLDAPLFYEVNVPTQMQAIVTATPQGASGDSFLELEARRNCGGTCEASSSRLAIGDAELVVPNPGTAPENIIIVVSNIGDRLRDATVALRVELAPF